jgi:hypothetical protein
MEQLSSHLTDFHEIWYLSIFRKYVEKFQLSLKSDKRKGYMKTFLHLWQYLPELLLEREMCQKKLQREKHVFVFGNFFFENRSPYEIMWKCVVEPDRPQMVIWRMRNECWIIMATNTRSKCLKTYCLCTVTVVARTHLNVMFIQGESRQSDDFKN